MIYGAWTGDRPASPTQLASGVSWAWALSVSVVPVPRPSKLRCLAMRLRSALASRAANAPFSGHANGGSSATSSVSTEVVLIPAIPYDSRWAEKC